MNPFVREAQLVFFVGGSERAKKGKIVLGGGHAQPACVGFRVVFREGLFVARHQALAERGHFVAGNRILLSESFTARALAQTLPLHRYGLLHWLAAWCKRDINRLLPLLRRGDGNWRRAQPNRWEGVKTCNLAAWREDLARINGLDESYSGWGLEDSDLVIRLLHAGVKHKNGRFATPVFHLWHAENDRSRLAENQRRLDDILQSDRVRAERGLDQYA